MTTTDGIYIDGTQILAGDMSGPTSAQMVLKNPTIDYAVLETARGGILRSGLGFDRCDIAVVTNVAVDHLGLSGIDTLDDLARVKAVVPQAVFRDGVIGAQRRQRVDRRHGPDRAGRDHLLQHERGQAGRARAPPPARTGRRTPADPPRRDDHDHRAPARDEPAPGQRDPGHIRRSVARQRRERDGRSRSSGRPTISSSSTSGRRLRSFTSSYFQTPGRFNFLEVDGRRVVMDYCHNVAGLESMADFVKRLGAAHAIGMIAMPGDRLDSDIMAFGDLAARTFDRIVIREDVNRRGRADGEIAEILRQSARDAGMADDHICIVLEEIEAVNAAIELAERDDLVVLLVDKPAAAWRELEKRVSLRGELV